MTVDEAAFEGEITDWLRLTAGRTRFLAFNRGHTDGAGNPPNPHAGRRWPTHDRHQWARATNRTTPGRYGSMIGSTAAIAAARTVARRSAGSAEIQATQCAWPRR